MGIDPITVALEFGGKIIDKLFPDKDEANRHKLKLLEMSQNKEMNELNAMYSAIVAEAKSSDPWTSRARPSFLYVIYILLLSAIPFALFFAYNPIIAKNITIGLGDWFKAIPDTLYQLFGIGYLGYSGSRTWDKHMQTKKEIEIEKPK